MVDKALSVRVSFEEADNLFIEFYKPLIPEQAVVDLAEKLLRAAGLTGSHVIYVCNYNGSMNGNKVAASVWGKGDYAHFSSRIRGTDGSSFGLRLKLQCTEPVAGYWKLIKSAASLLNAQHAEDPVAQKEQQREVDQRALSCAERKMKTRGERLERLYSTMRETILTIRAVRAERAQLKDEIASLRKKVSAP